MNISPWTEDESQMLFNLKKSKKSYKEIAQLLDASFGRRTYTENSCKKKWNDTNWDIFSAKKEKSSLRIEEIDDMDTEKQKVIETTLSNNARIAKREEARTQIIIDNCKSAIYRLPKPKKSNIVYTPKSKSTKYKAEHVGIILSDLHIGEEFTLQDTGGLSEYNLDIFKRRLAKLKKATLEIIERHRHMYELPHLHVFCLGDIVAGSIGAGAWNDNYIRLSIYDQVFHGTEALRDVLSTWSNMFKKVSFYGVHGNHGRVGKRGQEKISTNWDRIVYNHVRTSLEAYPNIEWHIPEAWWLQRLIQQHNFYLCHGDGIRGSMGIPYYGIERAEAKIAGLMEQKVDYILMGHFHSPAEIQTNSSRIVISGSFLGGDMYSLKDLGRGSVPEQKIFGIHEKKGITWTYNIYLDED